MCAALKTLAWWASAFRVSPRTKRFDCRDLPVPVTPFVPRHCDLSCTERLVRYFDPALACGHEFGHIVAVCLVLVHDGSAHQGKDSGRPARNGSGITPPTCRNHRGATVFETPAASAASAQVRTLVPAS